MNVVIVGGGIVGLATAYKLSSKYDDINIVVLEKENDVGKHQSTHNSGVLHCGLYYKPGSLKAKLAVDGIKQMTSFCKEHNIPHEICGKLVIATSIEEKISLDELYKRGIANGLEGLQYFNTHQIEEIKKIEPYVTNAISAIKVPQEGIVDYQSVVNKLKELIINKGHTIKLNSEVVRISDNVAYTKESEYKFDYLINCAGLYSDKVAKFSNKKITSRIVPFRGEYYKLKKESQYLVRNLIYPTPNPKFPFLGVHFTRLITGEIEAGPNAVLAFSREGYNIKNINIKDIFDYLSFKGFWKFIYKHKWMCLSELRQSLSKKLFCKQLQKLIPSITEDDLELGGSGVRAQAMDINGQLIQDFEIYIDNKICNVINAPSPAATASLAIADIIIEKIL